MTADKAASVPDLLDRYRRHLLAIYRTPCICENDEACNDGCAACIAEHGLYLTYHPDAEALTADDLDHIAHFEDGRHFVCADCPAPHGAALNAPYVTPADRP